jgi:hypothetical protein
VAKGPEQQRLSSAERDNLVAYLDHELNQAESRAIETKLTQSVTARREVEILKQTWELLDHLPMPRASENLTHRTLTEVAKIGLVGDQVLGKAAQLFRQAVKATACLVAAGVFFGIGLIVVRWVIPDPTGRLANHLSIAKHLDEYQEIGSLEYLERLDKSPEFGNETN